MKRAEFRVEQVHKGDLGDTPEPWNREWYYVLTGANGEPMATSETYTTEADAVRGAKDARKAARTAKIVVH